MPGSDLPDRRERLLNLLASLLATRRGLTREEVVSNVELGYPAAKEASHRAFERDKASLRAMGVPLREEQSAGEHRYRVDPKEYYLPDLGLSPEELAALHVAMTAVAVGSTAAEGALMKLGGLEGDAAATVARLPVDAALTTVYEASRRRAVAEFTYRGRARVVEPWGLTVRFGRWYMVGLDRAAGEMRVYRTDRIDGEATVGESHAFTVPDDFRPDAYLAEQPWHYGTGRAVPVEVWIDRAHAPGAIAHIGPDASVAQQDNGDIVVTLDVVNVDALKSFVLGFLEHAEVLGPPEVRTEILAWLDAMAANVA